MSIGESRVVRFGVFEVDLAARELRKRGLRIRLQDQPFRVLEALLEKPGEVITREQLKDRLWAQDEFVEFDKSLNTTIQKIRQTLGDSASSPRFVETVPRHGYRFVAPVERPRVVPEGPSSGSNAAWKAIAGGALTLLVVASYLSTRTGQERGGAETALTPSVPLTAYPGREIYPSFSPDEDRIAFTWEGPSGDNWDIYVKRVGEESAERLTDEPADDFNSVWSPDGRRIAFIRKFDSTASVVMTIPSVGGQARKVAEIPADVGLGISFHRRLVNWHPDGRHLFVSMTERKDGPFEIHVVDADTGEARKLLPEESTVGDFDPVLSPDQSMLAFRRSPVSIFEGNLRTVELTAAWEARGESRPVSGGEEAFLPAWTPDGRDLIFVTGVRTVTEGTSLWRIPAAGGARTPLPQLAGASFPVFRGLGTFCLLLASSRLRRLGTGGGHRKQEERGLFDILRCHAPVFSGWVANCVFVIPLRISRDLGV